MEFRHLPPDEVPNRPNDIPDIPVYRPLAPDQANWPRKDLGSPTVPEFFPHPTEVIESASGAPVDITAPPERRPAERAEAPPHPAEHPLPANPEADTTRAEHSDRLSPAMQADAPSSSGATESDETPSGDSNKIMDGMPAEVGKDVDHSFDRETSHFRHPESLDDGEAEYSDDDFSEAPRNAITADDPVDGTRDDDDDFPPDSSGELAQSEFSSGSSEADLATTTVLTRATAPDSGSDKGASGDRPGSEDVTPLEPATPGEADGWRVTHESSTRVNPTADTAPLLDEAPLKLVNDEPTAHDLKSKLEAFDKLQDDAARAKVQQEIWETTATVVVQAITEQNLLRAYRDGLIRWWDDPERLSATEDEVRQRHPLVARVWDTMKRLAQDVLNEAVRAAVIETLFPGAHLVLPPTGLVSALFTAGGLSKLADDAA